MDLLTYLMFNIHFSFNVELLLSLEIPALYHSRVLRGFRNHDIGLKATSQMDCTSHLHLKHKRAKYMNHLTIEIYGNLELGRDVVGVKLFQ